MSYPVFEGRRRTSLSLHFLRFQRIFFPAGLGLLADLHLSVYLNSGAIDGNNTSCLRVNIGVRLFKP